MKMNILQLLLIISLSSSSLFAQTDFFPENTVNVKLLFGRATGSSYFNLDGDLKPEMTEISADTFLFNYTEYSFGLRAEYSVTDKFVIYSELPFKYASLEEKKDTTVFDTDGIQYTSKINRGDFSLFQLSYFSVGGKYLLLNKKAYMGLLSEIRIPSGFHEGIQNDPDYNFLSDGAFEVHGGMLLGVKFEKSWLESHIMYKMRAEELSDFLYIHTEGGLCTVPGTKLMGFFDFYQSISAFENAVRFDPRKTTLIEDIFDVGVYFSLFINDNLYTEFSFKKNLLGKNTWNVGGFNLGIGVKL